MSDSPQYTPVPPQAPPAGQPQAAQSGLSDTAAGALAYVTIIPAIVFLLVEPYNKNSFVRFHAWQCIFLGITAIAFRSCSGLSRSSAGSFSRLPHWHPDRMDHCSDEGIEGREISASDHRQVRCAASGRISATRSRRLTAG